MRHNTALLIGVYRLSHHLRTADTPSHNASRMHCDQWTASRPVECTTYSKPLILVSWEGPQGRGYQQRVFRVSSDAPPLLTGGQVTDVPRDGHSSFVYPALV